MDYSIIKKIAFDCVRRDRVAYRKADVLTLAHDNDRHLIYSGRYYAPIVDSIQDDLVALGLQCISVARIASRLKGDLTYGYVVSPEGAFARALLGKRLKSLWMRKGYPYSKMEEAIWNQILEKTGAKAVVGILPSRELCHVCAKRGIWVADMQHGVIADRHPWYGASFRGNDPTSRVPRAFLCWDQGSKDVIDKWAKNKGVDSHVIGNRWIARFRSTSETDVMIRDLSMEFTKQRLSESQATAILVSLSWGEKGIQNGFIPPGLEQCIEKTSKEIKWYIRLHPNQLRGFATEESTRFFRYYDRKLVAHSSWKEATSAPLPAVLKNVDLHISWGSSVCIEASQMGVRTALLNPALQEESVQGDYYQYYRSKGTIDLIADDEKKIKQWIYFSLNKKLVPESYSQWNNNYNQILESIKCRVKST